MPEEPISKPEEEEEVLDLDELEREWEEEQKRKQEQKQYIDGVHETIEIDVIDAAITTTGTLLELYTAKGEVYVISLDEKAHEIMQMIEQGKVVHVKAVRIKGYKRLQDVLEISETRKIRASRNKVIDGVLDVVGRTIRIMNKDKRYYINEGTINYEKLAEIANQLAPLDAKIIASQIQERHGQRGVYMVVRGLYIVRPKPEEVKRTIGEEQEEIDTEENIVEKGELPEEVEV